MNEFALINQIKTWIPRDMQGDLGIGDDADGMRWQSKRMIVSTDALFEGVDFKWDEAKPEEVGHKILAINLSDLAAMGCKPEAFTLALGLPKKATVQWLRKFYHGITRLARHYEVRCLGGDLSRASEFSATLTILGRPAGAKVICRSGAKAGDLIAVTGALGGSILGHHLNFEPRVKEGLFLSRRFAPSSMIDISDGFWQDLEHILSASQVHAKIDLSALPISNAATRLARRHPEESIKHALTDGEDFELIFTLRKHQKSQLDRMWKRHFPKVRLSWVGEILAEKGPVCWYHHGKRVHFKETPKGYSHFSK